MPPPSPTLGPGVSWLGDGVVLVLGWFLEVFGGSGSLFEPQRVMKLIPRGVRKDGYEPHHTELMEQG